MSRLKSDLLASLSLANLCFLQVWGFALNPSNLYYYSAPPGFGVMAVLVAGVFLLGGVFWAASIAYRRSPGPLAPLVFLLVLATCANTVRQQAGGGRALSAGLALAAILALAYRAPAARLGRKAILALSPFLLVTFGRAAAFVANYSLGGAGFAVSLAGPAAPAPPGAPRVVWLIFDGLDAEVGFKKGPAGLKLPEFEKAGREWFSAVQALPSSDHTVTSIPAMLGGFAVREARPSGPSELLLDFEGRSRVPWSGEPAVFSRARELGRDAAVSGPYHPYCRVLGRELTRCSQYSYFDQNATAGIGLRLFANSLPGAFRLARLLGYNIYPMRIDPDYYAGVQRDVLRDALASAPDPRFGLVFIHFPIPHLPAVYDRATGRLGANPGGGYHDNVALADRTLGEVRAAMEKAGVWDRTSVLVTSDHGHRDPLEGPVRIPGDGLRPVPFLLKLPGARPGVYERPFTTVAARDLVVGILEGSVRKPKDAVRLLDQAAEAYLKTGGQRWHIRGPGH